MHFSYSQLKRIERPDPLWLYKVGGSLIKSHAEKTKAKFSDSLAIQTKVSLSWIENYFNTDEDIRDQTQTPLDPLIDAMTNEWCLFSDVFKIYQRSSPFLEEDKWFDHDRRAVRKRIQADVLSAFHDLSLLVHLNRVGAIDETQLRDCALTITNTLDKWGANGLLPLWEHYDPDNNKFLAMLERDEREIVPKRMGGSNNSGKRKIERRKFLKDEMHGYLPTGTEEQVDRYYKRLLQIVPETIGPDFVSASNAKEQLISQHITSGIIEPGNEFFWHAAILHPHSERMQKLGPKQKDSAAFLYEDQSLNITPEELENIRQGNFPKTVNEYLDAAFIGEDVGSSKSSITAIAKKIRYRAKAVDTKAPQSPPGLSGEDFLDALRRGVFPDFSETPKISIVEASTDVGPLLPSPKSPEPAGSDVSEDTAAIKAGADRKKSTSGASSAGADGGLAGGTDESSTNENDKKSHGWTTGAKVGTAVIGSILIADQYGRASNKDDAGKSEKKSKIIHYVIGAAAAAGVAVVVCTKPETLVKFVEDIAKFFKGNPGKAL